MTSIQELIGQLQGLKADGEELSTIVVASADGLNSQGQQVAALVRGSSSGQQAVGAISNASRALRDAAASVKRLGRSCDSCISNLSK